MDWKSALGSLLPEDYKPEEEPVATKPQEKQKGTLRVEIDRKRAGKTATIISGFTLSDEGVADLARQMKQRLGAGGSARGGEILIQGDRRRAVADFLRGKGYKVTVL